MRLWRVQTGDGLIASVAVSPNGRVVVSGSASGALVLWDAATGARLRTIPTANGRVRNLSFDGTGALLAAAGEWRTRVWDLAHPNDLPADVGGSEGTTDVAFRPDGRAIATCNGGSGFVRYWYLGGDARLQSWATENGSVTGLGLNPTTGELLTAGQAGVVSAWRAEEPAIRPLVHTTGSLNAFALSQDGRWLVTAGSPGVAAVWDTTGRRVAGLSELKESRAIAFAANDHRIVAGESNGAVAMWEWSDGGARFLRRIAAVDTEVLAIAAAGQEVLIGHRNRPIVVRDALTGDERRRLQPSSSPFSLAVSPDGRRVAAGTYLGDVDVWNAATGEALEGLRGQTALVSGLDFSEDGSLLALSSRDGSTRLWDVTGSRLLATVASRQIAPERVRFLPGARRLAIGYADGQIEILDLDYFFRYAAGNAEYQLRLLRNAGESFPRADEVLAWSRRILSAR